MRREDRRRRRIDREDERALRQQELAWRPPAARWRRWAAAGVLAVAATAAAAVAAWVADADGTRRGVTTRCSATTTSLDLRLVDGTIATTEPVRDPYAGSARAGCED